jgi:hypothetical protein
MILESIPDVLSLVALMLPLNEIRNQLNGMRPLEIDECMIYISCNIFHVILDGISVLSEVEWKQWWMLFPEGKCARAVGKLASRENCDSIYANDIVAKHNNFGRGFY